MPDSPCVKQCKLDKDNICLGCFRHLEEIKEWKNMDSIERENTLFRVEVRKTNKLQE